MYGISTPHLQTLQNPEAAAIEKLAGNVFFKMLRFEPQSLPTP